MDKVTIGTVMDIKGNVVKTKEGDYIRIGRYTNVQIEDLKPNKKYAFVQELVQFDTGEAKFLAKAYELDTRHVDKG